MNSEKVDSIPLSVSPHALLHRLGGRRNRKTSSRSRAAIIKATEHIRRHARPRAVYRILPVESENDSITVDGQVAFDSQKLADVLGPCEKAAAFLVTMGEEIDQLIHQSMETQPHYGVVLDTAASVAAEASAQYVQDHIEEQLDTEEGTTLRYSPGYCDWPLKEQQKLFRLLPNAALGVELSDTSFMSPSKSVSGLIGICPAGMAESARNACARCTRTNCLYRRDALKV